MRKITLLFASLGAMLALALPVTPARTQFLVSYVSGTGNDINNDCTDQTAPCATLGHALDNTLSGGEIICVSGGVLGPAFTIAKSVTIDCGSSGGGVGFFAPGITVNGPGIVVRLRNLTIDGLNMNPFGINATDLAALFIENCVIRGYTSDTPGVGINFAPNSVAAKLYVTDSIISNNGLPSSGGGIMIQPPACAGSGLCVSPPSARVVIERTRIENNTHGIVADGTVSTGSIFVQVRDSVSAGNSMNGMAALSQAGAATTTLVVDRSSSINNGGTGILAQGTGAAVQIANSTVILNGTGFGPVNGGEILSYGNNQATGNFADNPPTATIALR